jgi:hypothetical protein
MLMKSVLVTALLLALSLFPLRAEAQKTDIVILENGDRITGEIKKLEAGILRFSTDTMGTVNIEWRFIRRVISDKTQSMEMVDGTRIVGRLQKADDNDEVTVETPRGSISVDFDQIVTVWPVEASFKDRFSLDASIGFDYQKATETTDLTTAIDFRSSSNDRMTEASLRGTITRRVDAQDQTRYELSARHEYLLAEQRFRNWFGNLESNDALGVSLRISGGAAFGKYLVKNNSTWFSLAAGLMVTEEVPDDGDAETNLEAVGNVRYRYFRFADPERSLDTTFSVFPSLTDGGRYRASLRTTFKLELVKDLFWAMELWGNYDNQPISMDEQAEKTDYGITTSLGWSY